MNNWISYLIEVNVFIMIIGLSYQFGFRKAKDFKFGRPFLLIGTVLSFLLPFIKIPSLADQFESIVADNYILNTIKVEPVSSVSIDFQVLLILILSIGFAFKIGKIILGIVKINRLKQTCERQDNYYLIEESSSAFSFFNAIFIGSEIPQSNKEMILNHELVHKHRGHSYDLITLQIIQGFLWYNPMIYFISENLKELHEFEADQTKSKSKEEYLDLLLQQNFENYQLSFIHQFNSNHLKSRIMRIKNKSINKISKASLLVTAIVLSGTFAISQNMTIENVKPTSNLSELDQLSQLDNIITEGEVEKQAQFPGGQEAFMNYMIENIKYPKEAEKENLSGTVFIEFTVDKSGKCKDFKVLRGVNKLLDEAALEVLKQMPDWEAAEKDGKKVSSKQTVPIKYQLAKKD